jgi:hypothetical protein
MITDMRKRVERVLQERVPCPTRLQYDQWHSEGTRLLGSPRRELAALMDRASVAHGV